MEEIKEIVYVKTDKDGVITAIDSSAFISGAGWTEIDRGEGDKYHHAQGHYLEHGLTDADGLYNYKLVGGVPALRSDDEKAPERARVLRQSRFPTSRRNLLKQTTSPPK